MLSLLLTPLLATGVSAQAGIVASGPNGPTNPDAPFFAPVGSQVNQQSLSRLASINSVDDFCLWGPPEPGPDSTIGNTEHEVVAWCTKPRNNARLIPDGTIKSAQLLRTPGYIQISGYWDGTIVNIPLGDTGGEMDPHGPKGEGNPVGGNVTTHMVGGKDFFYEEWMSFISHNQFCFRICTAEVNGIPTALMCEHELDIMGCNFVMAIPFVGADDRGFTECDGDVAAPPGLYPLGNGTYSTFRQRFTGTWGGAVHTIGNTVTPSAPAFYPKSSNCKTFSSIANNVDTKDFIVREAPTLAAGGGLVNTTANQTSAIVVSVSTTSVSPTPVTTHSSQHTSSNAEVKVSESNNGATQTAGTGSGTALGPTNTGVDSNNEKSGATQAAGSGAETVRHLSIFGTLAAVVGAMLAL